MKRLYGCEREFDLILRGSALTLVSMKNIIALLLLVAVSIPTQAFAWGRRGHSIVCQSAAYLVANEPKAEFLKNHSFDLGYYCNTPDIIWKDSPAIYKQEWFNHFMDMEMFDRFLRGEDANKVYELDRVTFNKTFPQIPAKAGRSWWRIREVNQQLIEIAHKLSAGKLKTDEQHTLQADWLVRAGVIGHYIGDLSQPLHVSENYNGEITKQKGIHSYFEDYAINELFHADLRTLEADVQRAVEKRWSKERKNLKGKSVLELLQALTGESAKALPELLKIDRQVGRKDAVKVRRAYRELAIERLASGSVYLAEFYRRAIGFDFNTDRFFKFYGTPKYIFAPGQ